MSQIQPHGGKLINRLAEGQEREQLLEKAKNLVSIPVNAWTASDLDLIGVGAFSPLTGFMNEEDYLSVVNNMRLSSGIVWSIPITLAVTEETAASLAVGQSAALVGESDGVIYGMIEVESIYKPDKKHEAVKVFKTDELAHPGVAKLFERPDVYVGGSVTVLNRPVPEKFNEYYFDPAETRKIFRGKRLAHRSRLPDPQSCAPGA